MSEPMERRACITGAAQSQVGRRIYRSPLDLTIEGALRAIEDAGLTRDDIDGLASYPGAMAIPPGFSGPGTPEVQDALRLNLNWHAMYANRHFHEFGTTREQLAQIALTGRKNAALNPQAIYTEPMSMDDYFNARMVSTPFCLFDCDVPADGCTAVIVSAIEAAD